MHRETLPKRILLVAVLALGTGVYGTGVTGAAERSAKKTSGIDQIENIVVIYAENRSFDNLYSFFPGANGLGHLTGKIAPQLDRDGSVMKELPPICGWAHRQGSHTGCDRGANSASSEPTFRYRRSEGFQPFTRRSHS